MITSLQALLQVRYEFIRTPLEGPLMRLRRAFELPHRLRHPELREIYLEDERIEALLPRLIEPGTNCIDVGCHYGSKLSHFLRLAPEGRHVAFEPTPAKAVFLRRKFPEVDVRQLALSDRNGRVAFYVRERAGHSGLARGDGKGSAVQVDSARLDDVVPRDRRFGFLKIDTEGAELLVLRGARELLDRDRPTILFECGPGGPQDFGYTAPDLYDLITAQGYDIYFVKDALARGASTDRSSFQAALVYPFKAFNWLAAPHGVPLR